MNYYFIDGYNLIFSTPSLEGKSLQTARQKVIHTLQKLLAQRKITATLVFDGAHRREEESGLSYSCSLIIAYAPKGQSADEYIVEQLEKSSRPKQITVITNDRGLARHAKSYGAIVQSNEEFLHWLHKRKKKGQKKAPTDTQQNIDRLLAIFEERLKNPNDED